MNKLKAENDGAVVERQDAERPVRKQGLQSSVSVALDLLFLPSRAFRCSYIKMCPGQGFTLKCNVTFAWRDRLLTSPACPSRCGRRYSVFSKHRYLLVAGKGPVLCLEGYLFFISLARSPRALPTVHYVWICGPS